MPIIVLGEKLYSLKETAAMLQVTPRTLYHYLATKQIRAQKVAGVWRFTEADIREYIAGGPKAAEQSNAH